MKKQLYTKRERAALVKTFYAAAERLERGYSDFCCCAIKKTERKNFYEAMGVFERLFEDDARHQYKHDHEAWFEEEQEESFYPEVINRRILGLCLAAELTRRGELPWEGR